MKSTLSYQIQLDFSQIMQVVKQLPANEKIKLSRELEKDAIDSKLTRLLKSFKTNDLSEEMITRESEIVREKLYSKSHGK
jgi:hypothetical protein